MERKKKHQTIADAACEVYVTSWKAPMCWNHANAGTTRIHPSIDVRNASANEYDRYGNGDFHSCEDSYCDLLGLTECNLVR